jgi:hypothetical protein
MDRSSFHGLDVGLSICIVDDDVISVLDSKLIGEPSLNDDFEEVALHFRDAARAFHELVTALFQCAFHTS